MKRNEYWKNFNMGTELDVAGTFIYNEIYSFSLMENFYYEDEVFNETWSKKFFR